MGSACVIRGEIPADEFALYEALSSSPDIEFEVERIIETGTDAAMPLVWVRGADHEAVADVFENDPSVREIELLSEFDNEQLYRMEWISEVDLVLQMLTNSEATITDAYGTDGRWHLRVLYPDRESLTKTTEFRDEQGLTFDITAIRELEGEPAGRYGLTKEQFEALEAALEAGYYEVPRDVDQNELAEKLGISHQALSERLRRATGALVEDALLVGAVPDHDAKS
ncbi:helix-turn-helix domain-containing protein [Halococcus saccharolyticus]|uniref:DNA binding domain-containing protein n=1 Tax=Halococcus saccharolyticus DSM 5350 TaxID=1227455 RepID=M0MMQ7_9EURY|nr:helix-turn-helix domain-containing protein [Halococcus saccharolyticus]EMA46653.1 DNA binding domain-containing protein [Halococcus saccharolyticus DSM 5350]